MATEKIRSEDVVSRDQVSPEAKHRFRTDLIKLAAATVVVAVGLYLSIKVIFSGDPNLEKLRENAWTLATVIVSSGLGYMYGSREK